jgi:hypothetical protein
MASTRKLVGENLVMIEGTHLYPMESPQLTAQLTREMIARLLPASLATGDRRKAFA